MVDFVLVGVLVIAVCVALLQLALGLFGPAGSLRVTGHAVDEAALVAAAREEP